MRAISTTDVSNIAGFSMAAPRSVITLNSRNNQNSGPWVQKVEIHSRSPEPEHNRYVTTHSNFSERQNVACFR